MTANRAITVALCLLSSLFVLGCDEPGSTPEAEGQGSSESSSAEGVAAAQSPRIETLPAIDLDGLSEEDRRLWADLANDLLSPCGQPVSVARCVADGVPCSRCVPAARFLARLTGEGFARMEMRDLYRLRYAPDTAVELDTDDVEVRGPAMAPVTIVMFGDFECPHCRDAEPRIDAVRREFEGRVRLVFKNFPLTGHLHSMPAALAAVAARNQGKYWEMIDLLFQNQTRLEPADLEGYAARLGLDLPRFRTDMASDATRARVEADKSEGVRVGVEGTPAIFVNGRAYELPIELLGDYVREELDQ